MLAVSNGCLKMEYPRIQWFTSFPIKIAINWGMDKFWKTPNNIHCGGWRILDLLQDFALKSACKSTLICSYPIDLPRIRAKSLACPAKYSFLSFIFSVAATAAARKNSLPSWPDDVKYQHPSHRTPKIWRWPELAIFRTETFQLWNNSKPANTWKLKMLAKSSGQILWPNAARNQNHWNEAGPKSSKVAFQMQLRHMSASSLTWPQNSRNPANLQKARACGLSSAGQSESCRWPSLITRSSPTYTYTYKLMSKEQVDHSHCNVGQPLVGLIFYLFSGLGFMMPAKNQNAGWKYEVDPVWPASQWYNVATGLLERCSGKSFDFVRLLLLLRLLLFEDLWHTVPQLQEPWQNNPAKEADCNSSILQNPQLDCRACCHLIGWTQCYMIQPTLSSLTAKTR